MSKYLTKFGTHAEWVGAQPDLYEPNISLCETHNEIYYKLYAIVHVTGITLSKTELSMEVNSTALLIASVKPSNADYKTVLWASSDESVVLVGNNGVVKAVGLGTARVSAYTYDGGLTAVCEITVTGVTPIIPVYSVSLDYHNLSLAKDEEKQLTATILPSNATNKELLWRTSNNTIVSVDMNGLVRGVNPGRADITVITVDGGYTDVCHVLIPVSVTGVTLNKHELTLEVGDDEVLSATVTPEDATYKSVIWTSSNESAVTVNAEGMVSAIADGVATITVTTVDGDLTDSCIITARTTHHAESVSLDTNTLYIDKGNTYALSATVLPSDTTDKTVTWSSSDDNIATVDSDGVITAMNGGVATITVTTNDGGLTDTCRTEVNVPLVGISFDVDAFELEAESTRQLHVIFNPSDASNKEIGSWDSSNDDVATVDSDGNVTAFSSGNTTISVVSDEGGFVAQCVVTVPEVMATAITISPTVLEVGVENTAVITATILPIGTSDKTITWESSDDSIVSVSDGVVMGESVGTATISASTVNGLVATCEVTVPSIVVTGVTLNRDTFDMHVGDEFPLIETVLPENATTKSVTWSSSDDSVVKVNQFGRISGVSEGNATITVATDEGGYTAQCVVGVTEKVATSVTIVDESQNEVVGLTIFNHDEIQLYAVVEPDDAVDKSVTWTSDDPTFLYVDSNGKVVANNVGFGRIKATTSNGLEAVIDFTILTPVQNYIIEYTAPAKISVRDGACSNSDGDVLTVTAHAFNDGKGVITFSDEISIINDGAFSGFNTVTSIELPPSVALIGKNAFFRCYALRSILIPDSVESIDDNAFKYCSAMTSVNISDNCTLIGEGVFYGCNALTSATIGDEIDMIPSKLFYNCQDLVELNVTERLLRVGYQAFYNCRSLTSVNFDYIENISEQAFAKCSGLSRIDIGAPCTRISAKAFCGCTSLDSIIINNTNPTNISVGSNAFDDTNNCPIYVPKEAVSYYRMDSAHGWTQYSARIFKNAEIKVTSVTLNAQDFTLDSIGQTYSLKATIHPSDATETTVVWTSSNEAVATVGNDGTVTYVGDGHAIITAKCGKASAISYLNFIKHVNSVELSPRNMDLDSSVEESKAVTVVFDPSDATVKDGAFNSNKPSLASVDANGVVTAAPNANGNATITFTSEDGNKTAVCNVTIHS